MRILVTGGTGFVGSHIVEKLLDDKHEVIVAKRRTSGLEWLPVDKIELIDAPVTSPEPLAEILPDIDAVIHVAGITKAKSRADYFKINADGVRGILELCDKHAGRMQKFILMSSLAAAGCGCSLSGINETTPEAPYTAYGESKLAGEKVALEFAGRFKIGILRPPAVYGPRDSNIFVYFKLINRGFLLFIDDAAKEFSLIYVKDLAKAAALMLTTDFESGARYFVTDGEIHTWHEFGDAIANALGKEPVKITISSWLAWPVAAVSELGARLKGKGAILSFDKLREMRENWVCDGSLITRELGFHAQYGILGSVKETAIWYKENGWIK